MLSPLNKPARKVRSARLAVCATLLFAAGLCDPGAAAADDPLETGLGLIERHYLFYKELDPQALLGAALEHVEYVVGDVEAGPSGENAYRLRANGCEIRLEAPPDGKLRSLGPALSQTAVLVSACARDIPEDLPSIEHILLSGVLSGLDPYSVVLHGTRNREHSIQFRGQLAGIGARIGTRDGKLTLIEVYKGSPAHGAGLRDDDVVTRIDDLSTVNILVTDAVTRIRGKVGTPVTLTVEREGSDEPLPITVTRGLVRIPSVTAKLLDSGVIHAEISHFSQTTPDDFRKRVKEILAGSSVKGIIIDLRRNSGGSMLGSANIGDLFLNKGTLIVTAGRDGRTARGLRSEINAGLSTPFMGLPVAILTSGRTASGSELLAASLRNHDRAILVGERSFGKGTVQKTYRIAPESSLKLTIGRFLPNERPIPGRGMTPDVEVSQYQFGDAGVFVPDRKLEELPFWLTTPAWANLHERTPTASIRYVSSNGDNDDEEDAEDIMLQTAEDILAKFGSTSASRMLRAAADRLREAGSEADATLTRQLSERGIDWADGVNATDAGNLEVVLRLDGEVLNAGEESTVHLDLTNKGEAAYHRVRGVFYSDSRLINGRGAIFGMVPANGTRTWSFPLKPGVRSRTGRIEASLALFDDTGLIADLGPLHLTVQEQDRPRLTYRYSIDDTEDDTVLKIVVDIKNKGQRAAEDFNVTLRHKLDDRFELIDGAATIDKLEPGESTQESLRVRLLGSYEDPDVTALSIVDPRYDMIMTSEIDLSATGLESDWLEAPVITFERIERRSESGDYLIHVRATDESGLTSVLTRIDDDQFDYARAQPEPLEELRITLPWKPSEGVKRFEIFAKDRDGLSTRYVTGL